MTRGTVRGKIISNSALILLILAVAALYTGLATYELTRNVGLLFRNNRMMGSMRGLLDSTEAGLAGYLTTKSSDSLKDYIRYSTRLSDEARKLNRGLGQDESLLLQRDLAGLIDSYLGDTEASVAAKRGRDVVAYTRSFEASERSAELARYLVDKIDGIFLSLSLAAYSGFSAQISAVLVWNAILVVAAGLMGLMLLVNYSYKLTVPISRLAEAARAVGHGDYDYDLPVPESSDEIGTTTAAFASMQRSVRRAFEELKSKSEVEKTLMEERMRVLVRTSLTRQASDLSRFGARLDAMSPLKVLGRGYAIATDEAGRAVRSAASLKTGDRVQVRVDQGRFSAAVLDVHEDDE